MEGTVIGDQLKAARKLKGVKTTRVLADRINQPGFGEKVIGQIERNQRRVRDHEIAWLSDALQVPAAYLTEAPHAPISEETQLDRIERRLDDLANTLRSVSEHRAEQATDIISRLEQLEQALSARTDALLPGVRELLQEAQAARDEEPSQTAHTAK